MIRFENVSFSYDGNTPALQSVSLTIEASVSTALIGANGSGKTTLLNLLTGLYRYEGRIFYRNRLLKDIPARDWRSKIGVMFQNPDHQLFMPSVYDELKLSLLQHKGKADPEKIHQTLVGFGIEHLKSRSPDQLSMGEKKKVVLASILIREPELLLFDEPTAHLDLKGIRELSGILQSLSVTKIIATHDYRFAAECCLTGLILHRGRVKTYALLANILTNTPLLAEADLI